MSRRTTNTPYESIIQPNMDRIAAWARDGVSEKDMAHNLGISCSTWYAYKGKRKEFAEVLAKNKSYVDDVIVVGAYLKRILGYEVEEPTREYVYKYNDDGTSERVLVKEKVTKKHIPGDPRAAEFWLSRRQGETWPAQVAQKLQAVITEDGEPAGVIMIPETVEVLDDGNSVDATAPSS